MSEIISFPLPAGPNFSIPDVGELNWGQAVTDFLIAIPNGVPPTAGTFTLTGDLSFGPSFGLVSKYLISQASGPAAAGFLRLTKTDTLSWRNNAGTGDNVLGVNNADQLTFNGAVPAFTGAVNTGTQYQLGYYAANGGTISGLTLITPNRALQSDANGLPVASGVSSTTLSYLDATSSIQTQLDSKLPKAGGTMSGNINMAGNSIDMGTGSIINMADGVNPQDAATVSQVSAVSQVPTGAMMDFAGTSAPAGWLLCDGTSYPTASYPDLFSTIGYTWGGAGANFNVPDMRRRVGMGSGGSGTGTIGNAVGNTGGEETHTLTTPEIPSHTHTASVTDPGHVHLEFQALVGGGALKSPDPRTDISVFEATDTNTGSSVTGISVTNANTGGGGAHNNVQPSAIVLKIIKT